MFNLAWPWLLALIPLPLLVWWLLPESPRPTGLSLRVPFFTQVADTSDHNDKSQRWLRVLLAALAWLALVGSAARPQWIGEAISLPMTGRDLMLAVDISGSMETADMTVADKPVTRLAMVKAVAGEFMERRVGDRLGLILFGRRAYLQTPLTFDRSTARILLEESAIGLAGKETAIGDAIGLAVKRLRGESVQDRVLILLTDGANTAGEVEPLKAADLAASEKLKVYTIGVGADEMMVRSMFGTRTINPSADLDEKTLTAIADRTGGRYFRARDTAGLMQIYEILDELEPVAEEQEILRPPKELYFWPLGAALLISLILGALTALTKGRPPMDGHQPAATR
ncbi:MAG: VWA domain-containing protein [Lysobacterales bacterium]